MSIWNRLAPGWILLFLTLPPAAALNPNVRLSQYAHTAWRAQEGAFDGAPNAVTQTADGYIWIGTTAGLVRFDGVRFVRWKPPTGQSLFGSSVDALKGAADGSLWIGTEAGLNRWKDNQLIPIALNGRINQIIQDHRGRIWATRSRTPDSNGGFCEIEEGQARCFGMSGGMTLKYGGPITEDGEGNLWVGGAEQLLRWNRQAFTIFFQKELRPYSGLSGVEALDTDRDGSVWAAISTQELGLQHIVAGIPKKVGVPGLDSSKITALRADPNGALWIGTFQDGIYRLTSNRVEHFGTEQGLSGNVIEDLYLDREGGLWVATSKGLDYFRDYRVLTFSSAEGLSTDAVDSVLASRDGTLWFGNEQGLDFLRGSQIGSIRRKNGLPGRRVTALLEDHAGRLWVGLDNSLMTYEHGRFHEIKRADGKPFGVCIGMAEDRDGNVWVTTAAANSRIYRIHDLHIQEEFDHSEIPRARVIAADPVQGVWFGLQSGGLVRYRRDDRITAIPTDAIPLPQNAPVMGIAPDSDGSVWVARRNGLVHWRNGILQTLNSSDGLPCDSINTVIRDNQAALWLYADCGLMEIPDKELRRWENHPGSRIQARLFDGLDGALPGQSSFRPAASKSPDGRLWFDNGSVVQMIDPAHLGDNRIPPPVRIEQLIADRKEYPAAGKLRLPPRTQDLEIDYTGLSLLIPQKVRFRYQLEGRDAQWRDAGTRRQVYYNDLPPGAYRFHVIAANNDGVWNQTGAALEFSILPAWYQTAWFRVLISVTVIGLLALAYRLRVRQIAKEMNARFDERLAERTRLARELHDTLLQTIQGSKMVADDALDADMDAPRMRASIEKLSLWLGQAVKEGRAALQALRTSTTERNDLSEALQRAVEECRFQSDLQYEVVVSGTGKKMHPIVRDEVYRIGYEAIRNACLHSRASRLTIQLSYVGDLVLSVSDNGAGIAPEVAATGKTGHFGLIGMYERAARLRGKLTVSSSPGGGTEVELVVPRAVVFKDPEPASKLGLERLYRIFKKGGPGGLR